MIVVAIIGVLASVAIPAYNDYVQNAASAKVLKQYTDGQSFVQSRFRLASAEESMGVAVSFPANNAEWIAELNPTDALAPGGGPAWVAGTGNPATGALGVNYTGTWAGGTAQVVLTRPAYAGFAAESTTFTDN